MIIYISNIEIFATNSEVDKSFWKAVYNIYSETYISIDPYF